MKNIMLTIYWAGGGGCYFFSLFYPLCYVFLHMWSLFATFSKCSNLFATLFIAWRPFSTFSTFERPFHHMGPFCYPLPHVWAFLLLFSPCLEPFSSLCGASFGLAPPTKIQQVPNFGGPSLGLPSLHDKKFCGSPCSYPVDLVVVVDPLLPDYWGESASVV